jgi:hypothetical protein
MHVRILHASEQEHHSLPALRISTTSKFWIACMSTHVPIAQDLSTPVYDHSTSRTAQQTLVRCAAGCSTSSQEFIHNYCHIQCHAHPSNKARCQQKAEPGRSRPRVNRQNGAQADRFTRELHEGASFQPFYLCPVTARLHLRLFMQDSVHCAHRLHNKGIGCRSVSESMYPL